MSDIALCIGGTNWSQTGQARDPKQHLPQTDHSVGLRGEPRGGRRCTYGLESSIEKETCVTDIFTNDRFESKAAYFMPLKSCFVVEKRTSLSYLSVRFIIGLVCSVVLYSLVVCAVL